MRRHRTRLDAFMETHPVSNSALARSAGVSRQTVIDYRYGRSNETVETLTKLSSGLKKLLGRDVSVDEFFDVVQASRRRKAS